MRKLILFASLACLCACGPANNSQVSGNAGDIIEAGSISMSTRNEPTEEFIDLPAPLGKTLLLSGELGFYPVVMYLDIVGESLSGHYFYTKKGKQIDLKGGMESSGNWQITESVKGTATGYFKVMVSDDAVTGQWSAKPAMTEPLEVTLNRLDAPYTPNDLIAQRINGRYANEHTTTTYEGEDASGNPIEQEHNVKDEMAVRYIGGGYFSFWISVIGANFHTGEVYGLGKMNGENEAASDMEECDLKFNFAKPNNIDVEEVDCGMYHGARAWFGVSLTRK